MFSSTFHKDALFVTLITHSVKIFSCVQQVADSNGEFFLKSSELFESPVYLEEVADVLCILQAGQWCNIFDVKSVKNIAWQVSEKNTIKLFWHNL